MNILNQLPARLKLILVALPVLGGLGYLMLILGAESIEGSNVASQSTTVISSIVGALIVVFLLFAIFSIILDNVNKTQKLSPVYVSEGANKSYVNSEALLER